MTFKFAKKIFTRENIIFLAILFLISFLIGLSNYLRLPINNIQDALAFIIHGIILIGSVFGILYILSINRYIFILTFGPVLFLASIASWSLYVPNIPISAAIIDVMINTEWNVTREYLTPNMIIYFLFFISIIALIYYIRLRTKKIFQKASLLHYLIATLIIAPGWYVNHKRSNTISRRVPFSMITAFEGYLQIKDARSQERTAIGIDAHTNKDDSLIVILVLGESVRNDHLGLNGYHRNTTPKLNEIGIIPLPKTKSLYTYTGVSVPQILTRADSLHPERAYSEKSIIDIFNRCNFDTYWFANQNPEPSYYSFAKSCKHLIQTSLNSDEYSDKQWTDQNILSVFSQSIQPTDKQKLLVLHTIGSHWYYNYRYPDTFRKHLPITQSRSIGHNSPQEIINSYDNTILFMDYFISEIVNHMKHNNCILFYLSDHGELLGEDDQWLHAMEHQVLHDAASFIWMSDKYKQLNPEKEKALILNKESEITTSFLFHSILDAASIQTQVKDSLQNVFYYSKK
ncbi:sulfatase-like hydrolase/transferase [bacterium]|nr:sulfatase-like hydrolase/transferase [bacterium]